MRLDIWKLANEKGRVRRDILKPLKHSSLDANRVVVTSGNHKKAEKLLPRCTAILNILGEGAEIGCWALSGSPYSHSKSLLNDIWLEVTDGSILIEFERSN